MTRRTSLGKLKPGDEIFEKKGRGVERLGVVERIEKNVERHTITVYLVGGGGWSQNWAAHVLVKVQNA